MTRSTCICRFEYGFRSKDTNFLSNQYVIRIVHVMPVVLVLLFYWFACVSILPCCQYGGLFRCLSGSISFVYLFFHSFSWLKKLFNEKKKGERQFLVVFLWGPKKSSGYSFVFDC